MKKRTLTALFAVTALSAAMMAGCAGKAEKTGAATAEETTTEAAEETTEAETEETEVEEEDEENYDTGDASMDNTRNQDEIGAQELMVVSFGTSYNDNRRLTIGAIENAMEKAFPDYSVRRGFTSQIIIDHVKSRDNVKIDNVGEALKRAVDNEVKTLVIQPTHLMNGLEVGEGEYKKVVLEPLMIVAGDHANNDMAGDEDGSWKTEFEKAGYDVTCLVRGLGELEPIQQLFVEHAQAAIDSLK